MSPVIYTIGHSTRSLDELIGMLLEAGATRLADVRAIPRSKRHPWFNIDTLPQALAKSGIDYRHLAALGRRRPSRPGPPSRNTLWRVHAFRNYADYAETPDFRAALEDLERLARDQPTAYMCAEALWWRCHRRLITDYLLARRWRIVHLLSPGHQEAASMTSGAVIEADGTIEYPATSTQPRLIG